jgi:hypothetical protein
MYLILLQNIVLNHGVIIYLLHLNLLSEILELQTSRLASLKMVKEVWMNVKKLFASPPTDGRVFFNADLNWSFGATSGASDFLTVGLHELGHALGLAHSSVKGAVMWPYTGMNETRVLQDDDVHGIEALYGVH